MRIFLFPIPCASNQCTSALRIVPSKRRTVALPFSFRHRPLPYRFRRTGKIRIWVPIAMGSMSVILPTISKCIRATLCQTSAKKPSLQRQSLSWSSLIKPVITPLSIAALDRTEASSSCHRWRTPAYHIRSCRSDNICGLCLSAVARGRPRRRCGNKASL